MTLLVNLRALHVKILRAGHSSLFGYDVGGYIKLIMLVWELTCLKNRISYQLG